MSNLDPNIVSLSQEVLPPSAVDICLRANFTSETDVNLIIVRTNLLEIYKVNITNDLIHQLSSSSDKNTPYLPLISDLLESQQKDPLGHNSMSLLTLVYTTTLSGNPSSMVPILLPKQSRHSLAFSFLPAKLAVVHWDIDSHCISTIALHDAGAYLPDRTCLGRESKRIDIPQLFTDNEHKLTFMLMFDNQVMVYRHNSLFNSRLTSPCLYALDKSLDKTVQSDKPSTSVPSNVVRVVNGEDAPLNSPDSSPDATLTYTTDLSEVCKSALSSLSSTSIISPDGVIAPLPPSSPIDELLINQYQHQHQQQMALTPVGLLDMDQYEAVRVKDLVLLKGHITPTLVMLVETSRTWEGRYAVNDSSCSVFVASLDIQDSRERERKEKERLEKEKEGRGGLRDEKKKEKEEKPFDVLKDDVSLLITVRADNLPHDSTRIIMTPSHEWGCIMSNNAIYHFNLHRIDSCYVVNDSGNTRKLHTSYAMNPIVNMEGVGGGVTLDGAVYTLLNQYTLIHTFPEELLSTHGKHDKQTVLHGYDHSRRMYLVSDGINNDNLYPHSAPTALDSLKHIKLKLLEFMVLLPTGQALLLSIYTDGNVVSSMSLSPFCDSIVAHHSVPICDGLFFVGSRCGDSVLMQYERLFPYPDVIDSFKKSFLGVSEEERKEDRRQEELKKEEDQILKTDVSDDGYGAEPSLLFKTESSVKKESHVKSEMKREFLSETGYGTSHSLKPSVKSEYDNSLGDDDDDLGDDVKKAVIIYTRPNPFYTVVVREVMYATCPIVSTITYANHTLDLSQPDSCIITASGRDASGRLGVVRDTVQPEVINEFTTDSCVFGMWNYVSHNGLAQSSVMNSYYTQNTLEVGLPDYLVELGFPSSKFRCITSPLQALQLVKLELMNFIQQLSESERVWLNSGEGEVIPGFTEQSPSTSFWKRSLVNDEVNSSGEKGPGSGVNPNLSVFSPSSAMMGTVLIQDDYSSVANRLISLIIYKQGLVNKARSNYATTSVDSSNSGDVSSLATQTTTSTSTSESPETMPRLMLALVFYENALQFNELTTNNISYSIATRAMFSNVGQSVSHLLNAKSHSFHGAGVIHPNAGLVHETDFLPYNSNPDHQANLAVSLIITSTNDRTHVFQAEDITIEEYNSYLSTYLRHDSEKEKKTVENHSTIRPDTQEQTSHLCKLLKLGQIKEITKDTALATDVPTILFSPILGNFNATLQVTPKGFFLYESSAKKICDFSYQSYLEKNYLVYNMTETVCSNYPYENVLITDASVCGNYLMFTTSDSRCYRVQFNVSVLDTLWYNITDVTSIVTPPKVTTTTTTTTTSLIPPHSSPDSVSQGQSSQPSQSSQSSEHTTVATSSTVSQISSVTITNITSVTLDIATIFPKLTSLLQLTVEQVTSLYSQLLNERQCLVDLTETETNSILSLQQSNAAGSKTTGSSTTPRDYSMDDLDDELSFLSSSTSNTRAKVEVAASKTVNGLPTSLPPLDLLVVSKTDRLEMYSIATMSLLFVSYSQADNTVLLRNLMDDVSALGSKYQTHTVTSNIKTSTILKPLDHLGSGVRKVTTTEATTEYSGEKSLFTVAPRYVTHSRLTSLDPSVLGSYHLYNYCDSQELFMYKVFEYLSLNHIRGILSHVDRYNDYLNDHSLSDTSSYKPITNDMVLLDALTSVSLLNPLFDTSSTPSNIHLSPLSLSSSYCPPSLPFASSLSATDSASCLISLLLPSLPLRLLLTHNTNSDKLSLYGNSADKQVIEGTHEKLRQCLSKYADQIFGVQPEAYSSSETNSGLTQTVDSVSENSHPDTLLPRKRQRTGQTQTRLRLVANVSSLSDADVNEIIDKLRTYAYINNDIRVSLKDFLSPSHQDLVVTSSMLPWMFYSHTLTPSLTSIQHSKPKSYHSRLLLLPPPTVVQFNTFFYNGVKTLIVNGSLNALITNNRGQPVVVMVNSGKPRSMTEFNSVLLPIVSCPIFLPKIRTSLILSSDVCNMLYTMILPSLLPQSVCFKLPAYCNVNNINLLSQLYSRYANNLIRHNLNKYYYYPNEGGVLYGNANGVCKGAINVDVGSDYKYLTQSSFLLSLVCKTEKTNDVSRVTDGGDMNDNDLLSSPSTTRTPTQTTSVKREVDEVDDDLAFLDGDGDGDDDLAFLDDSNAKPASFAKPSSAKPDDDLAFLDDGGDGDELAFLNDSRPTKSTNFNPLPGLEITQNHTQSPTQPLSHSNSTSVSLQLAQQHHHILSIYFLSLYTSNSAYLLTPIQSHISQSLPPVHLPLPLPNSISDSLLIVSSGYTQSLTPLHATPVHITLHTATNSVAVALHKKTTGFSFIEPLTLPIPLYAESPSVVFYDLTTMEPAVSYSTFEPDEVITSLHCCSISNSYTCFVGVVNNNGPELACKGKIVIIDAKYEDGITNDGFAKKFLKIRTRVHQDKFPVFSLSNMGDMLVCGVGPNVMLYAFDPVKVDLVGKAFYACKFVCVNVQTYKDMIVVSDMFHSVSILVWYPLKQTLLLLGSHFAHLEVTSVSIYFFNNLLSVMVGDGYGNIQQIKYQLNKRSSTKYQRLASRCEYYIGSPVCDLNILISPSSNKVFNSNICKLTYLANCSPDAMLPISAGVDGKFNICDLIGLYHKSNPFINSNSTYDESQDSNFELSSKYPAFHPLRTTIVAPSRNGAIHYITPVDLNVFGRLQTTMFNINRTYPSSCGLIHKDYRAYQVVNVWTNSDTIAGREAVDRSHVLDFNILSKYVALSQDNQRKLAKEAGTTNAIILDGIRNLADIVRMTYW